MNLGDNMPTYQRDFQFPEDIWKTISKNIRKYRLQAGITQERLAVDIKKSYDFTRRLEFAKGKVHCTVETLYRISVVLEITMDKFFE